MDNQKNIRNFAIVAHIDHGKSTLADRLLEETKTIEPRLMVNQMLDSNPIERERGITIKLAPVRMKYIYEGQEYILNLIDTPGHVDFSYEVSRTLSACEGILLVVDAAQGIQAQTLAHMLLIKKRNLKVIPVINKIDLPTAKPEEVKKELTNAFGFQNEEFIEISAKNYINIDKVLAALIARIPPPNGNKENPFKSLVFSSVYEPHKGVIVYVRVIDGELHISDYILGQSKKDNVKKLKFYATRVTFQPLETGFFMPDMKKTDRLLTGEVGYIATGLKDLHLAQAGDTLCDAGENIVPIPGYRPPKPMVFLSFFPVDGNDFNLLREALLKLHLSDSSFSYKLHSSAALGNGYLCGFLGLLHADIIHERLEREFNLFVLTTPPTVEYQLVTVSGGLLNINSPDDFPDPGSVKEIKEPVMLTYIYTPVETLGSVMQLTEKKRAEYLNLEYIGDQAKLTYIIPMSEMIFDFFDLLKSYTSGYASLDYEFYEYKKVDAVKIDILINGRKVDAFSQITTRNEAVMVGEKIIEKLKDLIPRHQFQIPIQAAIGGKIIGRRDVKSFRKDVTAKLYGGDQTRKDKLLDAQRKGKKKMRMVGNVNLPNDIFLNLYKTNS